uniref:Helicase ATP-binding domain-containing protein n=1 Tax=Strongyloides papillosus TaxID=174720 RepID=A0A0N5BUP6_STREA
MDFFTQNILISGGSGTGKSTTVCIGLAAHFLSRRTNADNVANNDDNGNGGDEFRPGFNGDDQYSNVHADAAQLSFRFMPRNSNRRNEEMDGNLDGRTNASNQNSTNPTQSSHAVVPHNSDLLNTNQGNHEVNVPPFVRATGNNAHIFNRFGPFRAFHHFNPTGINIYIDNDNRINRSGYSHAVVPHNSDRLNTNQGNYEVNTPLEVRPSNTDGNISNESGSCGTLVLYNSNGMNIFHGANESNGNSTVRADGSHRNSANRFGSPNANYTINEEDMISIDSYSSDSDSKEDNKCGNQCTSEIVYRNGKAFAFVVAYKTVTCNEIAACLRYLVPQMNVVAITGAANWATNYEDICRADALIITFDHLEFFYRTAWTVYFPDLQFYVVEEAVSMSHRRHITSLEYFLENFVDRRAIQILIISRIISSADALMYKQLVGNLYTRCDLTRNDGVHGNNQEEIPNILLGQFRG